MDDPWDVKSVRQLGHYTSCMKINGVPLLPPVLSKECRKEMQYYKLLAKEVEKRISILQPFVESDTSEDQTDAPEIPECELGHQLRKDNIPTGLEPSLEEIPALKENSLHETVTNPYTKLCNLSSEHMDDNIVNKYSPPFSADFSLDVNDTDRSTENEKTRSPSPSVEIPERDCNCTKTHEMVTDIEVGTKNIKSLQQKDKIIEGILNLGITLDTDKFSHQFLAKDVLPSLSCKSFTGSLNNIYKESDKNVTHLVRQRSYTVLNPSPQLLAHLELQSFNLGVEVSCISMSDSTSNVSTPSKKRRSWDLETAKVKWSNMAQELKQNNLGKSNNARNRSCAKGQTSKRAASPPVTKFAHMERIRCSSSSAKPMAKSEPYQKMRKCSPPRDITSYKSITVKEPMTVRTSESVKDTPTKTSNRKKESPPLQFASPSPQIVSNPNNYPKKTREIKKPASPKSQLISESEDPATKVRELYEKIQRQQQIQMISLAEKQKREQQLLQQVFEEQNSLLFKQLKTICPKSPEEVKEAWVDKTQEADRGPVSLSQLINQKLPQQSLCNSHLPSKLVDSTLHNYLKHCDNVLKNSRDISDSIKKQGKPHSQNGTTTHSPHTLPEGSYTRTSSPNHMNSPTPRRLNYDTSASTDRDNEQIFTDRTNDTMADLNITFPSDTEERSSNRNRNNDRPLCQEAIALLPAHPQNSVRSTDSAITSMEQTIQNSIDSFCARRRKPVVKHQCSPKMRAAATKIVAHVKGYLVRRLMKTARVQGTVQTIKDALLCALQLHQDREGIRGADVDLHRRLIQQITAACYCLHDTFIASSAAERCAMIAADRDRSRRSSLGTRSAPKHRHSDVMSQSHTGAFPTRPKRLSSSSASLMTQSNYETYSSERAGRARYMPSPRRRPWR